MIISILQLNLLDVKKTSLSLIVGKSQNMTQKSTFSFVLSSTLDLILAIMLLFK